MTMWIQDDFWEAAQAMPEKQRAPFLYAVAEYGFTGKEPKGNPPWLPTFLVIKQRIELSNKKSAKGRKMAEARWGKRNGAQASAEEDAQARPQHMQQHEPSICTSTCTDDATACDTRSAEREIESKSEITPPYPPFAWRCLDAFNRTMGTAYGMMPPKCERTLAAHEGSCTVEDVAAMVDYKRDEWSGTRFAGMLTPNTLFSPEHFEQYMHQAKAARDERRTFDAYDADAADA